LLILKKRRWTLIKTCKENRQCGRILALAYAHLGDYHYKQQHYVRAFEYFEQAVKEYDDHLSANGAPLPDLNFGKVRDRLGSL
jgi:tetratricopeptide (TPR) repeat protein